MELDLNADYWPKGGKGEFGFIGGHVVTIHVRFGAGSVIVNGQFAKVEFNHIQLRFIVGDQIYIVFDDIKNDKRHSPPYPIAELYRMLTKSVPPTALTKKF